MDYLTKLFRYGEIFGWLETIPADANTLLPSFKLYYLTYGYVNCDLLPFFLLFFV